MQFQFPNKISERNFTSLEHEGMQALAMNAHKHAADCYDKVVLADSSVETIDRIVMQYRAAGLSGSIDCCNYWILARHREKWDCGKDTYGNFNHVLNMMRQKHKKYIKEQHQQIVKQSDRLQSQGKACPAQFSPPAYDDNITEQTALLKHGKPNY